MQLIYHHHPLSHLGGGGWCRDVSQENIHCLFGAVIYFNRHTFLKFHLIKCHTDDLL